MNEIEVEAMIATLRRLFARVETTLDELGQELEYQHQRLGGSVAQDHEE